MIYRIPTDTIESNFPQIGPLDGTSYQLYLLWNARARRWFMTLLDAEGNRLISGRKLCAGIPWGNRDVVADIPPGDIWVHSSSSSDDSDPGLRDLAGRVSLMYVDSASAVP